MLSRCLRGRGFREDVVCDKVRRGVREAGRAPSLRVSFQQCRRGLLQHAAGFFPTPFLPLVSVSSPSLCVWIVPFYSVFSSFACYSLDKRLGFHFTISEVVGFVGFCAQSVRAVGFVSGIRVFHRYSRHLLTAELW